MMVLLDFQFMSAKGGSTSPVEVSQKFPQWTIDSTDGVHASHVKGGG